ncbi:MAG: hypothetical protein ACR2GK_12045 [Gemmatimonadaceae bacterium]
MKKLLLTLILFTACTRAATTTTTTTSPVGAAPIPAPVAVNPNLTGGATPQAAVEHFLTAVRAEDIQGMSIVFGTSRGPARDNMSRDELEKRLVILQCYFNHDKFRILRDLPGEAGHRVVVAELTRGGIVRTPSFYTIPGPGGRHYVDNMEIAAVRDFCRRGS